MLVASEYRKFGLGVARQLCDANDSEWVEIFRQLRKDRQLSIAIHEINTLLDDPEHALLARAALQRVGLFYDG